ncbi:hypothetical protein ACDI35_02415 [Xanthomonas axonopodis pv. cajani]|uniref:hypothetical protein n=1 Tax=Xanthomonas axonopodis TaxID=53413 RepID=UPI003558C4F2
MLYGLIRRPDRGNCAVSAGSARHLRIRPTSPQNLSSTFVWSPFLSEEIGREEAFSEGQIISIFRGAPYRRHRTGSAGIAVLSAQAAKIRMTLSGVATEFVQITH